MGRRTLCRSSCRKQFWFVTAVSEIGISAITYLLTAFFTSFPTIQYGCRITVGYESPASVHYNTSVVSEPCIFLILLSLRQYLCVGDDCWFGQLGCWTSRAEAIVVLVMVAITFRLVLIQLPRRSSAHGRHRWKMQFHLQDDIRYCSRFLKQCLILLVDYTLLSGPFRSRWVSYSLSINPL